MKQTSILLLLALLLASPVAFAQEDESGGDVAKANNPLTSVKALNLQDYYIPDVYGADQAVWNQFVVRFAMPTGPILWRLSMPVLSFSDPERGIDQNGIGDLDLFAAYTMVNKPKFTFGLGPSASFPTATAELAETDNYQLGVAAVAFASVSPIFQLGGLVVWRADIGGREGHADTNVMVVQPFAFWQLGGGTYLRTAPIWNFNFEQGTYNVPFGFGIGKVIRMGNVVHNIFIEPQFTIIHHGLNQPAFQLYMSLNMQFFNKN